MNDDRIVTSNELKEDSFEKTIRPITLNDYIGVTEHAKIYIETLEAITYCEDCKGQYRTIDYGKKCPYCHSEHTYLLKGNEFNIKEIGIYEDRGT